MRKAAAINRLNQMLMEEISFAQHCEKAAAGDDIVAYHQDGVEALKMALAAMAKVYGYRIDRRKKLLIKSAEGQI